MHIKISINYVYTLSLNAKQNNEKEISSKPRFIKWIINSGTLYLYFDV